MTPTTLTLDTFTVGPLQENCYLLSEGAGGRALLVDPGDEGSRLLAALDDRDLRLEAVLLTHAHFDHVGALAEIVERYPVPVYLHPAERPQLERAAESALRFGLQLRPPPTDTVDLAPGGRLTLLDTPIECRFTPGHAPGHIAFYLPEAGLVFAGDALFRGSIGRTDLPGGDLDTLLAGIRRELLPLPPETNVYPGHGPATRIGDEARSNPFLT